MKASDYIVSVLESYGIEYIFGYQGGMITHLIDSISKSEKIRYIQCYHEQSAAFAAEGYARESGKFGVAIATSGPGATNLITGIGNAFFDSVPVLYITGQVNTYEYKYDRPLRQLGFQETDVVGIVTPITKYAKLVDRIEELSSDLEKSISMMLSGRKGPVLLDIPMNIQRTELDLTSINNHVLFSTKKIEYSDVLSIAAKIQNAKKPLVLCGGGIHSSGAGKKVQHFLDSIDLPYVTSLMGKGSVDETVKNHVGMIGSYGNRAANILLAEADVVLVLGSRLDSRQTGNKNSEILKNIHFIQVDIDVHESGENKLPNCKCYIGDLSSFIDSYFELQSPVHFIWSEWLKRIQYIKTEYSQNFDIEKFVQNKAPYQFFTLLQNSVDNTTIYTVDIGQNQMWAAQSLQLSFEQSFYTSGGMAPMGYAIPAAVGAAFAHPDKNIVCIAGDGGFHIALQSLMLISQYKLKITVIVLNNHSLGMITQFQDLYFSSNLAGTTADGGYVVPNIENIAQAYNLTYERIDDVFKINQINLACGKIIEINLNGKTTVVPKLEYNQPLNNMIPYVTVKSDYSL